MADFVYSNPMFRSDTTVVNQVVEDGDRDAVTIPSGATSVIVTQVHAAYVLMVGPTNAAASGIPLRGTSLEKSVHIALSPSATLWIENESGDDTDLTANLVWMFD